MIDGSWPLIPASSPPTRGVPHDIAVTEANILSSSPTRRCAGDLGHQLLPELVVPAVAGCAALIPYGSALLLIVPADNAPGLNRSRYSDPVHHQPSPQQQAKREQSHC
ncbi:hypothetical protein [Streptomyces zhihengii]|uniref:hypothetical protein n=1 Tax=Streptomyces zhihengii TaxID=1818004 RepID=UPI0036244E37